MFDPETRSNDDRFIGAPGAILYGAKILPAADFVNSGRLRRGILCGVSQGF
jgi:hypothetical protein